MEDNGLRAAYRAPAAALLRQQLRLGRCVRLPVASASMRPLMGVGESIVVSHASAPGLRLGDIVVYEREGLYYAHRLLRRGQGLLIAKGDAALHPDAPFGEEQLIGKVVAVERKGRELAIDSPPWRLANRLVGAYFLVLTAALRGRRPGRLAGRAALAPPGILLGLLGRWPFSSRYKF